jgi:hypothetical protein
MNRIEREKATIRKMIELYCRRRLKVPAGCRLPEEYNQLADYACRRLDRCRFGNQKKACKSCPVHCYAPKQREQIREVMRWVGPRMLLYLPREAINHLLGR